MAPCGENGTNGVYFPCYNTSQEDVCGECMGGETDVENCP